MTLREELEILRGEPIQIWEGDPKGIPCIETSDPELLCKHPVVSVHMITYNHEPYIREAIEGVMMQKTDFEFELVIGEDCSTDRTREICFEYQKKYPDRIRVLWGEHNLYRHPHPAGGNAERNLAHCRGEFIAICEGDDYWIDPLKLQKQVDVMRQNLSVGICFCGGVETRTDSKEIARHWNGTAYRHGLISGREAFMTHCFGWRYCDVADNDAMFLYTATVMLRQRDYDAAINKYDVFSWRLCLGDTTTWLGVMSLADAYYLSDEVSVYRRVSSGAVLGNMNRVGRDATLVRTYYTMAFLGVSPEEAYRLWYWSIVAGVLNYAKRGSSSWQRGFAFGQIVDRLSVGKPLKVRFGLLLARLLLKFGIFKLWTASLPLRLVAVPLPKIDSACQF